MFHIEKQDYSIVSSNTDRTCRFNNASIYIPSLNNILIIRMILLLCRFKNIFLPTSLIAIAPLLVVSAFGINLTAKHIQAVAYVEHGIGVDAVIAGVTATRGIDPAFVVALLTKQIVEVKGNDE